MDMNLSLSGSPEMVAHDLLVAAFNVLTAVPVYDDEQMSGMASVETHVATAIMNLRAVHPYLAGIDPS